MSKELTAKGMYAESLAISEKTLQSSFPLLAPAAYAYAKTGRRQETEELINRWKGNEKSHYVMNYYIARL